jgi:hypothetical protein
MLHGPSLQQEGYPEETSEVLSQIFTPNQTLGTSTCQSIWIPVSNCDLTDGWPFDPQEEVARVLNAGAFVLSHAFSRPFLLHFHFHHDPIVVRFTIRWSSSVQLGVLFSSDGAELTKRGELGEFVEGGEEGPYSPLFPLAHGGAFRPQYSEPAPTSAPSIGCPLDEPQLELIFGFTLVTNSVGN